MNNIAIIPARKGSKRIPGKNIKEFYGKPVIAYSIEAARKSGLFDEIMVSTDDQGIADIAQSLGAKVPFLRSEKNAGDFSSTADVINEVLEEYGKKDMHFQHVCCIYPVAPLIRIEKILEAYKLLLKESFKSVFPVVEYSTPIHRSFYFEESRVLLNYPENENRRTQDLKKAFYDAGQFYWIKCKEFLATKHIFSEYSGAVIISEQEAQDIDNPADWKLAELKYKLMHNIS